ncbi:MAG: DUF551 domain-containing protein [Flavobacteriales bacterium]|nr:DUF551 domain-containing protein [Flavobacteriales bacterium]
MADMLPMWIRCAERLPDDGQRVLAWLPNNVVHLPGMTGASEIRNTVVLRFSENFFTKNPSKTGKAKSPHFWMGEGSSNHFFEEVTHWMAMPEAPAE